MPGEASEILVGKGERTVFSVYDLGKAFGPERSCCGGPEKIEGLRSGE